MELLLISDFPPNKGGLSDYSFSLAKALGKKGHKVDVVTPMPEDTDTPENVEIVAKKPSSFSEWEEILSKNYDVVNFHYPRLRMGKWMLFNILNNLQAESYLTVHEMPDYRFIPLLAKFDNYLFMSKAAERDFKDKFSFISPLRDLSTFLIPYHGVDVPDENKLYKPDEIAEDEFNIVCPGFQVPRKRYHLVVEAMSLALKEEDKLNLILAGGIHNGEQSKYQEKIKKTIEEQGLEQKVQITGLLDSEDDVKSFIKHADICVLPYEQIYQSGVLTDCISLGTYPVVSPVQGLSEIVETYGGSVLQKVTPKSISQEILACRSSDLTVSSEKFIKDMSWDKNAERYIEMFEEN